MNRDTITLPRSVVEQVLDAMDDMASDSRLLEMTNTRVGIFEDARTALRAALEPQDLCAQHLNMVPNGWKLVPVVPTATMLNAWCDAESATFPYLHQSDVMRSGYRAMLAVAPQPPVVEQPQVEQEPVAYATHDAEGSPSMLFFDRREAEGYCDDGEEPTPLYTHPQPKREPLTDKVIQELADEGVFHANIFEIVRRIEEEHGIFKMRAHKIGGEA